MTKRYSTCQTVGELREALSGIPGDVALFGDVEETSKGCCLLRR